jgi:hypothetical protein
MRSTASTGVVLVVALMAAAGCGGQSGQPASMTINELMPANALTAKDENGTPLPWIELYNSSDGNQDLGGYSVTDDFTAPRKSVLPSGLVVPAHGYLVIWCDGNPGAGKAHVAVTLNRAGGDIGLARPDGSFVDRISYGAQAVDLSAAREPDGAASWTIEWLASPGAANPAGTAGSPAAAQAALAAAGQPEMVPAAGDLTDQILGYDQVPSFGLEISDDSLATLRQQTAPSDNITWVPGMLDYQGRSYGPVGISLRGTRSFQPIDGKAGFRVKLNEYTKGARFFGLSEMLFNNMTTDFSMMHERISYWVARQIGGLPGLRANHALVSVNGTPYGLYANVEAAKQEFVDRAYQDTSGSLYSIHYADFQPQYMTGFQLQVGPGDPADLQAVTDALANASSPDQAMAAVATHVDMKEFARYWAFCIVVGQFSSKWPYAATGEVVGNDAGLYDDPSSHLMTFIPEGTDDTFYSAEFDFRSTNSLLTETCKKSPSCFQSVVDQVWSILAQTDQVGLAAEATRVAAQIAPYVSTDPRKPYSDADVAMYQQQMMYFITGRPLTVAKYLPSQ